MAIVKTIDVALRANTDSFESGMGKSAAAMRRLDAAGDMIARKMAKVTEQLSTGGITAAEFTTKVQALDRELGAVSAGFVNFGAAQEHANSLLKGLRNSTEIYNDKIKELNALKKLGALTESQHAEAIKRTTDAYRASLPVVESVAVKTSFLNRAFTDFGRTLIGPVAAGVIAAHVALRALHAITTTVRNAIGSVVDKFAEIDEARTAAMSIGVATGELIVLRKAMEEVANVEGGAVDAALLRMNRNLADAAITGKGATEALDRIGLSASTLSGMRPQDAFLAIAEGISKLNTAGEKGAVTVDIFGKAGVKLLPMFQGNNEELQRSIEFFEKFGFAVSEFDATSIDNAGDSFKRIAAILEGLATQIATGLSPSLEAMFAVILGRADEATGRIDGLTESFAGLARFMADTADAWNRLNQWSLQTWTEQLMGVPGENRQRLENEFSKIRVRRLQSEAKIPEAVPSSASTRVSKEADSAFSKQREKDAKATLDMQQRMARMKLASEQHAEAAANRIREENEKRQLDMSQRRTAMAVSQRSSAEMAALKMRQDAEDRQLDLRQRRARLEEEPVGRGRFGAAERRQQALTRQIKEEDERRALEQRQTQERQQLLLKAQTDQWGLRTNAEAEQRALELRQRAGREKILAGNQQENLQLSMREKAQERLLAEQKKSNAHLAKIASGGVVLAAASL